MIAFVGMPTEILGKKALRSFKIIYIHGNMLYFHVLIPFLSHTEGWLL